MQDSGCGVGWRDCEQAGQTGSMGKHHVAFTALASLLQDWVDGRSSTHRSWPSRSSWTLRSILSQQNSPGECEQKANLSKGPPAPRKVLDWIGGPFRICSGQDGYKVYKVTIAEPSKLELGTNTQTGPSPVEAEPDLDLCVSPALISPHAAPQAFHLRDTRMFDDRLAADPDTCQHHQLNDGEAAFEPCDVTCCASINAGLRGGCPT